MKKNYFYQHENNISVCVLVEKSYYIKEKDAWSVRLQWWKWSPVHGIMWPLTGYMDTGKGIRCIITREAKKSWTLISPR
jgi:hypothetical protein